MISIIFLFLTKTTYIVDELLSVLVVPLDKIATQQCVTRYGNNGRNSVLHQPHDYYPGSEYCIVLHELPVATTVLLYYDCSGKYSCSSTLLRVPYGGTLYHVASTVERR